jgi:hypothetical protein
VSERDISRSREYRYTFCPAGTLDKSNGYITTGKHVRICI